MLKIANGLLSSKLLKDYCVSLDRRLVIITDSNLEKSYGKKIKQYFADVELLVFPAGEQYKTRETKQHLEDQLLSKKYGRDTCIIAFGGGVVLDLVGYLAATYCRGVKVIYLPTTLLAMVDASIGGKTGVNTPFGKNLIGTITQPEAVFMDLDVLITLPEREWRNGIVEIIKHALIADASLFAHLQNTTPIINADLIYKNCMIKQSIVSQDEHEKGMRQLLNFGHTIGHAIEHIENYNITHGEAVAIGMLVESYLSVKAGHLSESVLESLHQLLLKFKLPLKTMAFNDREVFHASLMLDKKSIKSVPKFVLLADIGVPYCQEDIFTHTVLQEDLDEALDFIAVRIQQKVASKKSMI